MVPNHDPNLMMRSMSITGNPDSPSEAIKNAQRKEALRKQFILTSKDVCSEYSRLDGA